MRRSGSQITWILVRTRQLPRLVSRFAGKDSTADRDTELLCADPSDINIPKRGRVWRAFFRGGTVASVQSDANLRNFAGALKSVVTDVSLYDRLDRTPEVRILRQKVSELCSERGRAER